MAGESLLHVTVDIEAADKQSYDFRTPFKIGRSEGCEVRIQSEYVSRVHAEVVFEHGHWLIRDLNSSNGLFVDGARVPQVALTGPASVRLGIAGPILGFTVELPKPVAPPKAVILDGSETMVAKYIDHYFAPGAGSEPAGEHTMLVRQAFSRVHAKQKRKYTWIVAAVAMLAVALAGYAFYEHQQTTKQRALAQELFYSMKSLDLDIANVEHMVADSGNDRAKQEIGKYQSRRKEMEKNYDHFLTTLRIYDSKLPPQDRVILRVARIFGECELAMPPGFSDVIKAYIAKWQSSGRLAKAIRTAQDNGYTKTIANELLAADLPPQFFYLALQESDFDQFVSGPMTRKGIAKGMWQFIPSTAVKYGLKVGPLVELRRPDPGDDRHHYDRATKAAAHYLKDLYSTDAQASGFLVMACYNWGEDYVLPLVRKMPPNPRERNYWKLLAEYREKIPQETYDYVYYIISAAVIGEDPRLFGFNFDNPLAYLDHR